MLAGDHPGRAAHLAQWADTGQARPAAAADQGADHLGLFCHRAHGGGAAGAAGHQADGQLGEGRLVAQPLEHRADPRAEQRRVVAGVRVAVLLVAGEQVEEQGGVAGLLQALHEVGLAGVPVVADCRLGDEDQPGGVGRVGLHGLQPDWAGGDAEGAVAQFHHGRTVLP